MNSDEIRFDVAPVSSPDPIMLTAKHDRLGILILIDIGVGRTQEDAKALAKDMLRFAGVPALGVAKDPA